MTDRWQMYRSETPAVAPGWSFDAVTAPSRLGGSNGMTIGADERLYVTQVFFSQITAIDTETGEHELFSPLGSGIVGPDDAFFGADGTLYATEPLFGRVTARDADGSYRVVVADLAGANGITMDRARQRLFMDEFRPGGRLWELDPAGQEKPQLLLEDLNGPNALSMGPDGRLYFPQVFADEIWVYDLDSGRAELLVDGVAAPTAVKFDSRGRIVTSEAAGGRITAIDIETGARETLAEVPLGIDNVSVGAGDRIFVSHYVDGRVAEETRGRERMLSEPGLLGPFGLTMGRDGRLRAGDGLSAAAISTGGAVERLATLLVNLPGLAVGACELGDDLLVLGVGGEILRYRGGGGTGVEADELCAGLEGPTAIEPEGVGSVLVVESGGGRIRRVHADGQTEIVAADLQAPGAVAIGPDGELYVSQGDGGAVVVVGRDGSRRDLERFAGAQGIALAGTRLLVADAARHELVVLDVNSGQREVVVRDAPIGAPVEGVVPAAFCSVCPDGEGGFYVGCNGDGSIRRLSTR